MVRCSDTKMARKLTPCITVDFTETVIPYNVGPFVHLTGPGPWDVPTNVRASTTVITGNSYNVHQLSILWYAFSLWNSLN